VVSLLSVYCSSKRNNTPEVGENIKKTGPEILLLPSDGEDTLKVSFFADTVLYVPLETTEKSLVGNIMQIWTNDSLILINSMQQELMMFKITGDFVEKIGKIGRGPGEYVSVFCFDVILDTLYISSSGRSGFLRYTLDGAFIDEIKLNYQPVYINTTIDNKLVCYDRLSGNILVYNNGFESPDTVLVEYGVTIGRSFYVYMDFYYSTYLQKTATGLLFNNYISDTVWNITNTNKEPVYILDTNDELLPYDKQIEFCEGNYMGWGEVMQPYFVPHLLPIADQNLILQTHWNESKYNAIFLNDPKTGETRRFNSPFIYDDIVGKQKLEFIFHTYSPNYLIAFTETFDILKKIKQNGDSPDELPSDQWLKQMETVNESEDNEVLALIKIKK
jgi:hypothetical protein